MSDDRTAESVERSAQEAQAAAQHGETAPQSQPTPPHGPAISPAAPSPAAAEPAKPRGNPVEAYLGTLSTAAARATVQALRRIVRVMGRERPDDPDLYLQLAWWQLSREHTLEIRRRMLEQDDDRPAVRTVQATMVALRGVLKHCLRLGYLDGPTFHAVASWPAITGGDPILAGRVLERAEIALVREAYGRMPPFESAMDGALFELGLASGAKMHEIVGLQLSDLSADARKLRIIGNHHKVRRVVLPSFVGGVLEEWLTRRGELPFSCKSIFVHIVTGKVLDEPLPRAAVWRRLQWLAQASGVAFTVHDLRRTFASAMHDKAALAAGAALAPRSK